MRFRYFVFDMDGTLIESGKAILAALREMEKRLALDPLPEEILQKFLGPPLKKSFMNYYHVPLETTDYMTDVYRECYMDVGIDRTEVFDGVPEFLAEICRRGGHAALATLKQHQLATEIISRTGLGKYFEYVALNLENNVGEKAAQIRECLEHMGCHDLSQAVMFGDSPYDGQAAARAGVHFVPLTCGQGFQDQGELEKIDYIFAARTPREMGEWIRSVL